MHGGGLVKRGILGGLIAPAILFIQRDRNHEMASFSLTLIGVESVKDVNKVTTALMMMDGVKEAEVGRGFAEVEGQVRYDAVVKTVEKAGYKVK